MKDDWERRRAYLELDTQALAELVHPCFPGRSVAAASHLAGGLANTIYKIDVSGLAQPLVLRLYTRDATTCQKDVDIWNLVHRHVPIPQLLYADPHGSVGGVPYTINEFASGVMLSKVLATSNERDIGDVMFGVGHTLAEVGRFQWIQAGFFGPGLAITQPIVVNGASHVAYIEQCLLARGGTQRLGNLVTEQLLTLLHTHAPMLDVLQGEAALVHADFNAHNILVEQQAGRWRITAVLDWEFAFAGPCLFDVGNMLRNQHRLPASFAQQFTAGFADGGGNLPHNWHKLSKLLDLLNLCDLITIAQLGDTMAGDLTELIQRTIKGWDDDMRGLS